MTHSVRTAGPLCGERMSRRRPSRSGAYDQRNLLVGLLGLLRLQTAANRENLKMLFPSLGRALSRSCFHPLYPRGFSLLHTTHHILCSNTCGAAPRHWWCACMLELGIHTIMQTPSRSCNRLPVYHDARYTIFCHANPFWAGLQRHKNSQTRGDDDGWRISGIRMSAHSTTHPRVTWSCTFSHERDFRFRLYWFACGVDDFFMRWLSRSLARSPHAILARTTTGW